MSAGGPFISALRAPLDSPFALMASQDFYQVHKLVYGLFPGIGTATAARVLFRFDIEGDNGWLYFQSLAEPDWSLLPDLLREFVIGTRPLWIPTEERLRFRLLARPTRCIGDKENSLLGRRVSIDTEEGQRAWLARKGAENGFEVEACALSDRVWLDSKRGERLRDGSPKPILATQFDGILNVTDTQSFRTAIARGIGTQKAFGFGLLSVART